ncbi:MAG: hypothetical protein QOE96_2035 [Blastocatellia bacterium]|jgi:hypothetical protein|nr:hypothetical protein [Blastocatellia bacterium]
MSFRISSLRNSTVWGLYRLRDRIEINPVYQREGDIWNLDKQQLLIDTIINQFDVPKLYLHKFPEPVQRNGRLLDYAVIDGKQRLTSIWRFIDGQFALADNFEYLKESVDKVVADNLTYAELAKKYPNLKNDFDSFALDVVSIETDDLELIEEMFSRLNEAVPLSAAEKRNAIGGPLPAIVRRLAQHPFFSENVPFSNRRYRHFDMIAKMLIASHRGEIVDTKKAYLDGFFIESAHLSQKVVRQLAAEVSSVLDAMHAVFVADDPLLRQVSMVLLYFHAFKRALEREQMARATRRRFVRFDEQRLANRSKAEEDIAGADYDLLEFDRLSQSPNDAVAMRFRLTVIDRMIFSGRLHVASDE